MTDEYVELPWHRGGAVKTGLRQRCAVHCGWLAEVDPNDVERISGFVPGAKLQEIARKIAAHKPPAEDAESVVSIPAAAVPDIISLAECFAQPDEGMWGSTRAMAFRQGPTAELIIPATERCQNPVGGC